VDRERCRRDCGEFCVQLAQRIVQRGGDSAVESLRAVISIRRRACARWSTDQGPLRADAYVLAAGIGARAIA
jgi:glycine/D-amino acid oxidase-like deaminating enzyme